MNKREAIQYHTDKMKWSKNGMLRTIILTDLSSDLSSEWKPRAMKIITHYTKMDLRCVRYIFNNIDNYHPLIRVIAADAELVVEKLKECGIKSEITNEY